MTWPFARAPRLPLGSYGPPLLRRTFSLPLSDMQQHGHIIGTSGTGKSRFLAYLCVALLKLGMPVTLLDPHGELARLVLALMVEGGFYTRPEAYDRILYLDLAAAEQQNRYLPFNVLAQPGHSDTIAANVKDAFHRAFPELGETAATFDTLLPDAVELLVHNGLPLTALHRLLVDEAFRAELLAREADAALVSSFRDTYEQLRKADQVQYAGSVLRRARQLTRTRILKYGLSQSSLLLDFHRVLRRHQAVIVNLAVENRDARRFLGSLLTVGLEQAAQARRLLPPNQRYSSMHLLIDEFQLFTSHDADQFTDILSETRKFKLFLWMAHQEWGQVSERLKAAVQNAGVEVVFGLGREDSEYTARKIARVDLEAVKHVVEDESAEARTHPVFRSTAEQWEAWIQSIQDLGVSEAYVSVRRRSMPSLFRLRRLTHHVTRIRTLPVPRPVVPAELLATVEQEYLRRYFISSRAVASDGHADELSVTGRTIRRWEIRDEQ
jgi:hypothetical protein